MEYQVLARKWRPANFEDLIGQEHIAQTLQNSIAMDRVAHAYLFTGIRGVGKTSSARILAMALNCEKGPTTTPCGKCDNCREISSGSFIDVLEIDGASNTGVDDVRELKENIQYLPSKGRFKIYIIDEVHMLSKAAFNALLKTLEEPPPGVKFIFATTEPNRLPDTILSRCQQFDFKRVGAEKIVALLKKITVDEKFKIAEKVLFAVAKEANGSVRDSLTLLDRLISYCGNEVSVEQAWSILGLVDRAALHAVISPIIAGNPSKTMEEFHRLYFGGFDLKRLLEGLMAEFRLALLLKVGMSEKDLRITKDEASDISQLMTSADEITLEHYFDIAKRALFDLNRSDQEQFIVELALLRMCRVKDDFISIKEAIGSLSTKSDESRPQSSSKREPDVAAKNAVPTNSDPSKDSIEDSYVRSTVKMFDAKVEKIQIREK